MATHIQTLGGSFYFSPADSLEENQLTPLVVDLSLQLQLSTPSLINFFPFPAISYEQLFLCSFTFYPARAGKFKEQSSSNSAWLPVLNSRVPEPRPGTCVNDTSNLPDTVLNFIRSHPLMDKAVNHEHNNPVYYKRDLVFTKLVVDKWVENKYIFSICRCNAWLFVLLV